MPRACNASGTMSGCRSYFRAHIRTSLCASLGNFERLHRGTNLELGECALGEPDPHPPHLQSGRYVLEIVADNLFKLRFLAKECSNSPTPAYTFQNCHCSAKLSGG